ncbi:MAG: hypothetical protein E7473_03695 [Ruminococcaceae bacterium]|nr:hypothetical protein [Oscillospiraceae bacterium]
MKKLISVFLIVCLVATLLPSIAFATEADIVSEIVIDFTQTTLTTNTSGNTSYEGLTTPGYEINPDKSTTRGVRVNFIGNGLNTCHDQGYSPLSSKKTWPGEKDKDTVKNLMLTISVDVEASGYYAPEIIYGTHNACGDFVIYINGQYAGEITDAWNADVSAKTNMPPVKLNTVYLKEGKNEVSFKCILHRGTRTQSYLLLNKLTFTPCKEAFVPVTFAYDFPEKVVAGEPAEFTVSANFDESQTKFSGTYNEDGSTMDKNLTVASENGTFEITEQSENALKGTFTATSGGAVAITATANINGKTYSETIEATATAPIVATFSKTAGKSGNYTFADLATNGYTVDMSKSCETAKVQNNGDYIQVEMYCIGSSETPWPTAAAGAYGLLFTINVTAPTAGYYSTNFEYGAWNSGADFTMYINGVAAGVVDGYIWGNNATADREKAFNTVYLNEGTNEVSFRLTKTYKRTEADGTDALRYNGYWFRPRKLTFTPVDVAPAPVGFTSTLTETKVGESVEFTVKPVMSDGSAMYFGIYDDAGTKITDNPITLTTTSGTITNLIRTTDGVNGIFTATEAGNATISASTTINGTSFTVSFDVTVTSDEDEVVTLPTTITMSVSTDSAFAGNLTVNGEVQESEIRTYSVGTGDTVIVKAEDIDGKIFRGWLRGGENGKVVCLDSEYTFTAATNVALFAKYTDAPEEETVSNEYYDWNGEFLAYTEPDRATLSKYGFSFKEWLESAGGIITRYVADYAAANTYTITKPDSTKLQNVAHETEITLTNPTAVSWYVNDVLAAYGTSYSFYATEDAIVTIDNEVQTGPIVKLNNPNGNTYILEYNVNGADVIEKGIIIGNGEPTVTSCFYKVISQRSDAFGKLMANNDTSYTTVRGYVIYNDNGTYRVVYANIAE